MLSHKHNTIMMKNYISHRFPRQQPLLRAKISILEDQPWNKMHPSSFCLPFNILFSGNIHDFTSYRKSTKELQKIEENSRWFRNLVFRVTPVSTYSSSTDQEKSEIFVLLNESCAPQQVFSFARKDSITGELLDRDFPIKYTMNDAGWRRKNSSKAIQVSDYCNTELFQEVLRNPIENPQYNMDSNRSPSLTSITKSNHEPFIKEELSFLSPKKISSVVSLRSFGTLSNSLVKPPIDDLSHSPYGRFSRAFHDISSLKEEEKEVTTDQIPIQKKKKDLEGFDLFYNEAVMLQPSRAGFSIRKLIAKTTLPENGWGLPRGRSFVRTIGPRMNDNLFEYIDQRCRLQSEARKSINLDEDNKTTQKVKLLIRKAKEKNKEYELKRLKNDSTRPTGKKTYRSLADSMDLKSTAILKMKEKKAKKEKTNQEPSYQKIKNKFSLRKPLKEEQNKILQLQKPIPSSTEYQSSASYKDVFKGIFSKPYKKKHTPKTTLAVFNRQSAPAIQTMSQSVNELPSSNSALVMKKSEKVQNEELEKNVNVPEHQSALNLRNKARTPFQKVSNTQLMSKSKASFSTMPKISLRTLMPSSVSISELLRMTKDKLSSTMKNMKVRPKLKVAERTLNTNTTPKLCGELKERNKERLIRRTLYSAIGYYPLVHKTEVTEPIKSMANTNISKSTSGNNKKNHQTVAQKGSCHTQGVHPKSGYFNQRRSLSSCGTQVKCNSEQEERHQKVEPSGELEPSTVAGLCESPLHEQVFMEVMRLCQGRPADNTDQNKSAEDYGRCSVEKKPDPEKRKGFVCRLAGVFNIGCGRRRRPYEGCSQCGK